MNRTIVIDPRPAKPADTPPRLVVVTPHSAAAGSLGVRKRTLFDIGRDILKKDGYRVASEAESFAYLKRSISVIDPSEDPAGLAKRVRTIINTLLRTGISMDDLEKRGSQKAKQVARIAREYEGQLSDQALIDHSAVLWRAALLGPEPLPLFVYGYFRARKEEVAFINTVAGEGSIYYLPCGSDPIFEINRKSADWMSTVGDWQLVNDAADRTDAGTKAAKRFMEPDGDAGVTSLSFDDVQSEVRHALSKAKRLMISGVAPENIAILCRDTASYTPLLCAIADEYGTQVEVRDKIPLENTLLGSFIEGLLSVNETDFEFETTASLLMHPFGPGLSAYEWKMARKDRVAGAEAWATLSRNLSCLIWPAEATAAEWVAFLRRTFQVFDVRRKTGSISREILAYNTFLDALSSLDVPASLSMSEFFSTVRELLATIDTPFQPTRFHVLPLLLVASVYS